MRRACAHAHVMECESVTVCRRATGIYGAAPTLYTDTSTRASNAAARRGPAAKKGRGGAQPTQGETCVRVESRREAAQGSSVSAQSFGYSLYDKNTVSEAVTHEVATTDFTRVVLVWLGASWGNDAVRSPRSGHGNRRCGDW